MHDVIAPLGDADVLVIVGIGLAGLRVAESAREMGFGGKLVLISDEAHAPYDRPPLSKGMLLGDDDVASIALAPKGLESLNADVRLGVAVVSIDRAAKRITLSDGADISYSALVLATGSRVRELPLLPRGGDDVHYVRTLDDALRLRSAFRPDAHGAIVGGGVIGLEVAAAARKAGCAVTLIEPMTRVMPRNAAPVVSEFITDMHRAAGVLFVLGAGIESAMRADGKWRLHLSNGAVVEADFVVVGIGVVPNTALAAACGLEVDAGGIVVDACGRSSDASIYAAGEVALHDNAQYGPRTRMETWSHAVAHGEHVGRALMGSVESYAEPLSYWTDQYDVSLKVVGAPQGDCDIVRGDPSAHSFLVFHIKDGVIAGVSAANAVRELRSAKKLLGRRAPDDLNVLSDVAEPLAKLA